MSAHRRPRPTAFVPLSLADAEGQFVVIDRCMIAKAYIRGWFWIDLFSSFPYEAFDGWMQVLPRAPFSHDLP